MSTESHPKSKTPAKEAHPTPAPVSIIPKDPVTTDNYVPRWDEYVEQVFVSTGLKSPINKTYCLTTNSAEELAVILADLRPKIVQSTPYAVAAGSVAFTQTVPWFKFPSGAACNCGLEAAYWGRPGVGTAAEANCRKDLASNEECYAADGDSQYPLELQGSY